MPPRKPRITLCVSCAVMTAVIAAVSIIPSMPRLIMPARSTTSSPRTASSSGVDATIASGMAARSWLVMAFLGGGGGGLGGSGLGGGGFSPAVLARCNRETCERDARAPRVPSREDDHYEDHD